MPEKYFSGKYKLVKLINDGPYAKVYHARDTQTCQSVAIKIIDTNTSTNNNNGDNKQSQSLAEVQAMSRLRHRHVINLMDVFSVEDAGLVFIVTEFAKCGDLFDKVAARGRLTEDLSRHYFQQLISAVKHCHSRGVYHRDIKPENLLLDAMWNLKLSDFGLSVVLDPNQPNPTTLWDPCGTHEYAAPEVIAGRGYDGAMADVWSCGVVLYVLSAGYLPFDGKDVNEMWKKMRKGEFTLPKWMSPGLKWLLLRILDPNPDTRITIDEIIEDNWFSQGYEEEVDDEDGSAISY